MVDLFGGTLKKLKLLSIVSFSFFCFVSFQNCNKVQLTDVSANSVLEFGEPETTSVVVKLCQNSPHDRMTKSFLFPKPAMTCAWEKDGNLAPLNNYFQARIEQNEILALPKGAVICEVKLNFEKQQFLYDDHFLLSFNDAIIASSFNFEAVLARRYNLLRYDWAKIAGMYWDKKQEGVFCAAGGVCSWPSTDTAGFIALNYEPIVFQKIMAEDISRNEHAIKFVSIGDNDDKDCEHSDVRFSLDVEYVFNH